MDSQNVMFLKCSLSKLVKWGQARSQGGARGPAAPPPLKVGAPQKKTQKMKPPCYCWQYRPQTQPIIDQATDLTVCKIGSLIVTVGLYII